MQELFEGQDAISRNLTSALAGEVDVELPPASEIATRVPVAEAYDLYLRGRQIWHRRGSVPLEPAVNYFAEAVKVDPEFARGWAALASAYISWPSYSPKGIPDLARCAEEIAKKALELDPSLAEPYGVLGDIRGRRRAAVRRGASSVPWKAWHVTTGIRRRISGCPNTSTGSVTSMTGFTGTSISRWNSTRSTKTPRSRCRLGAYLMFGDPADGLEMFDADLELGECRAWSPGSAATLH